MSMSRRLLVVGAVVGALLVIMAGGILAANPKIPHYGMPAFMTCPGQAPEYAILEVYLKKEKINYTMDPLMEPSDLKTAKCLILIIGGSGKGLGAAGIDLDDEAKRAKALIAEARKLKIPIIGFHIGGEARLGENSQVMIDDVTPLCDFVIVRKDGDVNGDFSKNKSIPATFVNTKIYWIEKNAELSDVLVSMFK